MISEEEYDTRMKMYTDTPGTPMNRPVFLQIGRAGAALGLQLEYLAWLQNNDSECFEFLFQNLWSTGLFDEELSTWGETNATND